MRGLRRAANKICLIGVFAFLGFIVIYEVPPLEIILHELDEEVGNVTIVGVARDLIVQEATREGIWATRGYSIYFKPSDQDAFIRVGRIPVPFGISWALKFRIVRGLLNKQEVLDLLASQPHSIIAIGGGHIFQSLDNGNSFNKVYQLDHFGFGIGRGVMPQGYTAVDSSQMFLGEYWRNPERTEIQLFKSDNGGRNWEPSFVFKAGEIRHIHAVQYDPYFDALWVATGDRSHECSIMYSKDGGISFTKIGSGSQKWRACSLIFDMENVYWGMDGSSDLYPEPLLWKWNRKTEETEIVSVLDSDAFYSTRLSGGTLTLSTDGSNGSACLWQCTDGENWVKSVCWDQKRKSHFGNIRMVSFENDLILSNINLKSYNNDLLLVR